MKLSFSNRGWKDLTWDELLSTAGEMRFGGIELHDPQKQRDFMGRGGPFHKYAISATVRNLRERRLAIPCLDSSCDLSVESAGTVETLRDLFALASDLRVPCVCAWASRDAEATVRANIAELLPEAARRQVTLLVKTCGVYADTARLRDLLNSFARDELAVLWDMHHTYRDHGESAARTIENLGAYVRHVHLRDSDDATTYNLIGEGTLPVKEMMEALSSINYDGFISL